MNIEAQEGQLYMTRDGSKVTLIDMRFGYVWAWHFGREQAIKYWSFPHIDAE